MHNRQIEIFIQVADSGSFSKAADAMFLSSVAVMKQVNALEERLGVKLLRRTKQGVSLTPAGQLFYEESQKIIAASWQTVQRIRDSAQPTLPSIRIGTSAMRPCHVLSAFDLNSLPFRYEISPFFDETVGDLLTAPAKFGEKIDCFAGPYDSTLASKYSVLHLMQLPYRIAVPYNHPLAKAKCLSMESLYGETLLLIEPGNFSCGDSLRKMLETDHPQIKIKDFPVSGSNFERFNEAVRTNSLLVSFDIWSSLHPAVVTLPAAWNAEVPYGLICPKNPSKKTREFIAALQDHISAKQAAVRGF